MTTTLITGANKGLGRETARQLIALGHTVYLGCRDAERGQLAAKELGGIALLVDVTDDASVDAAARRVDDEVGQLDVLVNNAGITGGAVPHGELSAAHLLRVYDTNVFGVVRMTSAFLPLLQRAAAPVVVNVSSGLGSFGVTHDPARMESGFVALAYPSSKSAVNMLTAMYAKAFPEMRINCVDPGYTATDLNEHRGYQSVEQGAAPIVAMSLIGADGPTGGFIGTDGTVPW